MMHSKITMYDLAIEDNFSKKEAKALYFLDDIPLTAQIEVLDGLERAIGRYKLDKRDWNNFKKTDQYKKIKKILDKYDKKYNDRMEHLKQVLIDEKVSNIEIIINNISEKNEIPTAFKFGMHGDYSLSMKSNVNHELITQILFRMAQLQLERKTYRKEMRKTWKSRPSKKKVEEILLEVYSKYFNEPVSNKVANFLKTFN